MARPRKAEDRQAPGECHRGDERDDLPRPGTTEAEIAQQVALALEVEPDDTALPLVVHRIPMQAQALEPGHVQACEIRHRLALRQRGPETAFDARRCDGGSRIEALPCAGDERFGPRVRIGVTHDHVAPVRVDLSALIAGDDARRNAGGAQQHDERAGVVFAESASRVEQKGVDRIACEQRRCQRVGERLLAEPIEHCGDVRAIGDGATFQLAREFDRPRIAARQLQIVAPIGIATRRKAVCQCRALRVANRLRYRRGGQQLLVVREHRDVLDRTGAREGVVFRRSRQAPWMFQGE